MERVIGKFPWFYCAIAIAVENRNDVLANKESSVTGTCNPQSEFS